MQFLRCKIKINPVRFHLFLNSISTFLFLVQDLQVISRWESYTRKLSNHSTKEVLSEFAFLSEKISKVSAKRNRHEIIAQVTALLQLLTLSELNFEDFQKLSMLMIHKL